jgi:hypothetical protein
MRSSPRRRTDRAVLSTTSQHDGKGHEETTTRPGNNAAHTLGPPPHPQSTARIARAVLVAGSFLAGLAWPVFQMLSNASKDPHIQDERLGPLPSTYKAVEENNTHTKQDPSTATVILSIYAESVAITDGRAAPLPNRTTSARHLKLYEYPQYSHWDCMDGTKKNPPMPIDEFPLDDPFLPW